MKSDSQQFIWKGGGSFKHADPQAVGERLQHLEQRHNSRLTPAVVINDARSPSSILHECFEWDDARAGEQYRLAQARALIHSIRVVTIGPEGDTRSARVYVNLLDPTGGGQSYRPVTAIIRDDDLRQQALSQASRDMRTFIARYQEIAELVNAAQDVIDLIEDLQSAPPAPRTTHRAAVSLTE